MSAPKCHWRLVLTQSTLASWSHRGLLHMCALESSRRRCTRWHCRSLCGCGPCTRRMAATSFGAECSAYYNLWWVGSKGPQVWWCCGCVVRLVKWYLHPSLLPHLRCSKSGLLSLHTCSCCWSGRCCCRVLLRSMAHTVVASSMYYSRFNRLVGMGDGFSWLVTMIGKRLCTVWTALVTGYTLTHCCKWQ